MEKKIGIITFHNSINYGAVMQTYGLQEYLKKSGYEVEVIDYMNKKIEKELNSYTSIKINSPKSLVRRVVKNIYRKRKAKVFQKFNLKNLNLSNERNIHIKNINQLRDRYDVMITGSDQVWNLNLTGNDKTYFLDFAKDTTIKIGYAVSVGDVSKISLDNVLSEIKKFSAISIREKTFLEYAKSNYNISATLCADPTILAGKEYFDRISSKKLVNVKYIFCFLMENKPEINQVAKQLSKEYGYKIIDNKSSVDFFMHCKPEDFLSCIKNAEYVLTDSFHGTVFSVLFQKKFVSDKYDSQGKIKSRVLDLLTIIGLDKNFIGISLKNKDAIKDGLLNEIDYRDVNNKLKIFSNLSGEWLIEAIEGKSDAITKN